MVYSHIGRRRSLCFGYQRNLRGDMRILLSHPARFWLLIVLGAFTALVPRANAAAGNKNIKIVAWYGAGNLSKSEYGRDTIILFNPTQSPITMTGWSIQTGSTTGTFTTIYQLPTVTMPAGTFYTIAGSGTAYISSSGCTATTATPATSAHSCETTYAYDYQLKTLEGTATSTDNDLSSTAVTAALVSSTVTVGTCPTTASAPTLVDMLGIEAADGSSPVTCYAGGGPASYTPGTLNGATTSIHGLVYAYGTVRKNPCVDTYNNDADFALGYINFTNLPTSTASPQVCPAGNQLTVMAVATPDNPALSKPLVITATVTSASLPTSTALTVTADLTSLGSTLSATQPLYDDGSHGDAIAGDGIFTYAITAPAAVPASKAGIVEGVIVSVTDAQGNKAISDVPLTIGASTTAAGQNIAGPGNNNVEIVAWYGAGNLSGSQYARDTIILFNPTSAAVNMSGWSIQTGGATGAFTTVYDLPSATTTAGGVTFTAPIIAAGGYYAIAGSGVGYLSSLGCTSTNLASPCNLNYTYDYELSTYEDAAANPNDTAAQLAAVYNLDNHLSSAAVTAALVNNQTALGSNCPLGLPALVDIVGIGAFDGTVTNTCYPGTGYAPYVPSVTARGTTTNVNGLVYPYATVRSNRCSNTFDSSKDFYLGYIDFENTASTPRPCVGGSVIPLTVTASASPNALGITDTFTLTARVTPATGSSNLSATADLSNLGLSSATPLYDDGTHGDAVAGDDVFTVATASTIGTVGAVAGLSVTAKDAQGDLASTGFPLTLTPGIITLGTTSATATVAPGGNVVFNITATASHGYGGILGIICTGSPNTNSLGVPISTECVPNPPELTIATNGTATLKVGIAAGTTFSASAISSVLPFTMIGLLSIALLTVAVLRRKLLPLATLIALMTFMTVTATGCGKNGGIGNTNAAPGTYTYVITATDTKVASIKTSLTLTLIVQ
jgi:hypothetical protein